METLQTFELAILDWIQASLRSPALDAFFPVFSTLCNNGELWIAMTVILLFWKKYRKSAICVGAGLLTNMVITNLTLKPLFGRIRPFMVNTAVELLVKAPSSSSFPSGHTACSFAAVAALRTAGNPLWKPAAVVAVLMGFSRMYLYVHWPTDILGGAVIGWFGGWLGAKLVLLAAKKIKDKKA